MRALITNDDGIESPGLRALAAAVRDHGYDVVVAAPSWDSSGASASLTAVLQDGRLLVERREWDGFGPHVYAVEAAPAFIVRAAMSGAFADGTRPDLVVSGINLGPNTGRAVLHSGTVGAAFTAVAEDRPALAVSIGTGERVEWHTAARVAGIGLGWLVRHARPVVLNVNVPNVRWDRLRGIGHGRLAPFGAVQATTTEVGQGYVKLDYHAIEDEAEPGTDVALLRQGYASFTALESVCEASVPAEEFRFEGYPTPSA